MRMITTAPLLMAVVACSAGMEEDDMAPMDSAQAEASHEGSVTLTEAGMLNAGIQVEEAGRASDVDAVSVQEVPGRVEFGPDRVALISPRTGGRLERLTAVEGDRVRAGAAVAYLLSTAFLTAQEDLIQAARRADLLAGSPDEEGARALLAAAERRIELLGAPSELVERLTSGGAPEDLLPVIAPFDGSLVEAYALEGASLEAGSPIFRIGDLSVVDVVADVPEQAIGHLQIGREVAVHPAAFPDRTLRGRIERLHDELDPQTRTLAAIVHVPNPDRTLRPGMFASVDLRMPIAGRGGDGTDPGMVSVPASAVVTDGPDSFVFVETGPRTFEQRAVTVMPIGDRSRLGVLDGLLAGDRVVVRGAFTLRSELGKAAFGEHD